MRSHILPLYTHVVWLACLPPMAAIDPVKAAKRYKAELCQFYLDLKSWKKFQSAFPLSWQKLKFDVASKAHVPNERGIYVFVVEAERLGLPPHGYICYVGIAGKQKGGTLRKRYANYLREAKDAGGRPAVVFMLNNFKDDLFFHFVPIPDAAIDLEVIESSFINSVAPPVNKGGFQGELSMGKKAAF